MTNRVGTNYYPSEAAAYRYYRAKGYDIEDLYEMIAKRKIHIGTPPLLPGQWVELIDGGNRWAIAEDRADESA